MFNEKLKYYRKKQQFSQEELANQIGVSRQIITKWESGVVIPSVEYLISLSDLFSITIDALVKDDDCCSLDEKLIGKNELNNFLVKAKRNTYAAKKGKITSLKKDFNSYQYCKGEYSYVDSFVGSSSFSGNELVCFRQVPIWSMNYYGQVLGEHFQGDFLKKALLEVPLEMPYRGPECFTLGDYHYYNRLSGGVDCFSGKEEIFYQGIKVYGGYYHGGQLK